jgi:hypothetical protein
MWRCPDLCGVAVGQTWQGLFHLSWKVHIRVGNLDWFAVSADASPIEPSSAKGRSRWILAHAIGVRRYLPQLRTREW